MPRKRKPHEIYAIRGILPTRRRRPSDDEPVFLRGPPGNAPVGPNRGGGRPRQEFRSKAAPDRDRREHVALPEPNNIQDAVEIADESAGGLGDNWDDGNMWDQEDVDAAVAEVCEDNDQANGAEGGRGAVADVPVVIADNLHLGGANGSDRVGDGFPVIIDDNLEANEVGGGDGADEGFLANIANVAPEDMYEYVAQQGVIHGINVIYQRHYNSDSDPLEDFLPQVRVDPESLLLRHQDPQSSLQLAQIVARIPRGLKFDLLRLLTESNVTREFTCDLLTLFRPHVRSALPKDYRTLAKDIPIAAMSSWITHICMSCQLGAMYKYNFGHRGRIQFPECVHKVLDYNSDHYIVADVAEVLALVLPSIWKWRNRDLLPPHMKTMMLRNNMDFSTDITLTISSDGVQVFNSSGLSVWSVMLCVDGIPYHIQRKSVFEVAILCAREEGKNFQVTCMLDDILKQVQRLNLQPFSWLWNGVEIKTPVLISRAVADTPARSTLQGLNMFRSLYGCNYCYQTSEKGYCPHSNDLLLPRTNEDLGNVYAREDFSTSDVQDRCGVKYKSVFARLPFDLVEGFPPDIMHCGYAGVMKLLIELWISKPVMTAAEDNTGSQRAGKNSQKRKAGKRMPYQLTPAQQDFVNRRLLQIRPPERTKRKPQELSKVGTWKAQDLSMFLLYYGPVVLRNILPKEYYDHYLELVAGIALLSSKITDDHVSSAQDYLNRFSAKMRKLYGAKAERFNVHLLRHLPSFCQGHGILPLFSMYMFENANHRLVNYVNGPVGVSLQMFRKSMVRIIMNCRADAFDKVNITDGCLEWDLPGNPALTQQVRECPVDFRDCSFYAIYKPGRGRPRIVSKDYSLLKSRKGYLVMLDNEHVGIIQRYFVVRTTGRIYGLVEKVKVCKHSVLGHIRYKEQSLGIVVVPVTQFREQVIEMESEGTTAYAVYLNNIEHVAE